MIREDYRRPVAPVCTCTPDPDGQTNTDGCVLHDLVVVGVFVGEENQ